MWLLAFHMDMSTRQRRSMITIICHPRELSFSSHSASRQRNLSRACARVFVSNGRAACVLSLSCSVLSHPLKPCAAPSYSTSSSSSIHEPNTSAATPSCPPIPRIPNTRPRPKCLLCCLSLAQPARHWDPARDCRANHPLWMPV